MSRLSRSQVLALAGVVVLLAGAVALRDRDRESAPARLDLAPVRTAAALQPCPAGLGPELPALVLPCLGGGPDVDVRSAAPGRPTLVNVWATWCAPCVDEVPELVELAARAGDRLAVVGVLTEDPAANGLEFARQYGMRYPSVVDEQGDLRRALSPGVPVTLFLDAQGRVVHTKRGPFAGRADVDALVREHLGVELPAEPAT